MQIIDAWFRDIPQQFLGKKRIEVLIRAFARQLQELQQVFDDMNNKLDLGAAAGRNLDYVGTIIPLTRKEAGELAGLGMSDAILSDEKYASILKYKLLRNTSSCTYYDIMEGLEYLYDFRFGYKEDAQYPATILLEMPLELDQPDLIFRQRLCIKPSGVGILGRKIFRPVFVRIAIEYAAGLVIRGDFWPRSNIPRHYLNGTTRLDGRYPLSGYLSGQSLDFYPLVLQVAGMAVWRPAGTGGEEDAAARMLLQFRSQVRQSVYHGTDFSVRGAAELALRPTGQLHLSGAAGASPAAGAAAEVRGEAAEVISSGRAGMAVKGEADAGILPAVTAQILSSAGSAEAAKSEAGLIVEKAWGTLDGSRQLDGSRMLDAARYAVGL